MPWDRRKDRRTDRGKTPLEWGYNYMHYSLIGKKRLPVIESDLLYRGTL